MNKDLQQRFLDCEISPPPSVWNEIAVHLDEKNENIPIREKVLDIELPPPSGTWQGIREVIHSKKSGSATLTFLKRRQLPQAAAIIAGVILLGSLFLLNNKFKKSSIASIESSPLSLREENFRVPAEPVPPGKPLLAQIASGLPKAGSIYSALKSKKKNPPDTTRQLDQAVVKESDEAELPEPSVAARPIRNEKGDIIQDLKMVNKPNTAYLSVTGPNGAQTKISAKFAHFLLYLNGDNDIDSKEGVFHKSFLESLTWKARFQSWRNLISQNAFVPTSTNFMDILELKDLILQQKDID